MHPNPVFRQEPQARALAFASDCGFGALTAAGPDGVLAAHVPFVLEGDVIATHMVRSNPLARLLKDGPVAAMMMVTGPYGYISPDWYGEDDKVPTWNYVAVHLRGQLRLIDEAKLLVHLDRLSAQFENRLLPKKPWKSDKMTPDILAKMLRQIVPVEMIVEAVESTFKLNQNRGAFARNNAATALEAGGTPGSETLALAALMREAPDA
ncbi:MAG TPA: FMN-binding negative transcriptional regulator [Thermohalobaculum sp.]|nr:FMN-binding negative transcriptional regulator [Thermohalobaculum sp.]